MNMQLNNVRPVSKGLYIGVYIGGAVLGGILMVAAIVAMAVAAAGAEDGSIPSDTGAAIAAVGGLVLLLASAMTLTSTVFLMMLFYKMWSAIQDGHARTTPGKAVGFLFIPLFNLYWVFQVLWGFSKDYNAFLQRHRLPVPLLSENLFLWTCIVPLMGMLPVVGYFAQIAVLVMYIMVMNAACNAINGLANLQLQTPQTAAAPTPTVNPVAPNPNMPVE